MPAGLANVSVQIPCVKKCTWLGMLAARCPSFLCGMLVNAACTDWVLESGCNMSHTALSSGGHVGVLRRNNYRGTQQLLDLAGSMTQLESFVYVSTFYVNNFKPFNSPVQEEVHHLPLQWPGRRMHTCFLSFFCLRCYDGAV
jgi:hypothetical protein